MGESQVSVHRTDANLGHRACFRMRHMSNIVGEVSWANPRLASTERTRTWGTGLSCAAHVNIVGKVSWANPRLASIERTRTWATGRHMSNIVGEVSWANPRLGSTERTRTWAPGGTCQISWVRCH